jgi:hypothetical protein
MRRGTAGPWNRPCHACHGLARPRAAVKPTLPTPASEIRITGFLIRDCEHQPLSPRPVAACLPSAGNGADAAVTLPLLYSPSPYPPGRHLIQRQRVHP